MAYGLKWFSEFSDNGDTRLPDIDPVIYRVEILQRDYSGESVEVLSGSSPFTLEDTTGGDINKIIREQKATIEWISEDGVDFDISEIFITDDRKYQVRFYEYIGESLNIIWYGFLVPIECEEPFHSKPYPVTMAATCGLPYLSDDYFLDSGGAFVEGKKSLISLISHCLLATGLDLDIHTNIDLYEEGMSTSSSPLQQAEIDADGLRGKKAYDILQGLLSPFWAFVTQENGVWAIRGRKEQTTLDNLIRKYSPTGSYVGEETVSQAVGVGRTAYGGIPVLRPTEDVSERLAEPNSIVTETVSPGIPVNRLSNGTFSGAVLGGTIPGWNNHIGGISWARQGFNKPDDPYRLEIYRHVEFDPKKKKNAYNPFAYFDTGPIRINVGDFNIPIDKRKEVKIVVMGALRMNNALGFDMFVTLNESEREFASYLDENGDWFYSKKEDRPIRVKSNQSKHGEEKTYEDIDTQPFEVTSKNITNFVKESNEAIAYIRVRILPGIQAPGYLPDDVFLSIEDLAVFVTTDTVFEGEHKYQVDGLLPIRDANEVNFTTIIADKIDIITPEQERTVNRVMTGYMTRTGGDTLTSGWKYPDDGTYEPIQKRALRNRVRQLCGKRRVIDGVFYGYDLRPGMSVFNLYDDETPSDFFAVTGWKWDVKNLQFDATLHELDFTPLAQEDIYLYDDEDGRRGNRMYRNASSSSSGGSTPKPVEEIVLNDIPPLYYTVGELGIKLSPLEQYIESSHLPYLLDAQIKYDPDWITNVVIDRGEDGDKLWVAATGTPLVPGTDSILVELIGLNGEDYLAYIPIIAVPATKLTHYLIDTTGGGNTVVGKIKAGSGYMKPDSWRIDTVVDGFHEGYFQSIDGPGVSYSSAVPYEEVLPTSDGEYSTPSQVGAVGVYNYNFATFRNEGDPLLYAQVKGESFNFILYDEEYLNMAKFELWVGGVKFGDIDPDGSSAFNTEGQAFQVKVITEDLERDAARLKLDYEGVQVHTRNFTHSPSVLVATYDLYSVLPSPQAKGYYELSFEADEETVLVYDRIIGFTINEKKKTPVGGNLTLVAMRPGQSAYDELGTLSLSGNLFTLPASPGWNVLDDSPVVPGLIRSHKLFQKRAGALVEVNTSLYSGVAQSRTYLDDSDEGEYLIFGTNGSTLIDKIHGNNTSFRVIVTDELDGVVTEIKQGDFSFGTLEDLDDLEVEEPGSVTYAPGHAMGATTVNNVTAFNWRPDGVTLEVFEPESPDVVGVGVNHARLKDKAVTFAKIQDVPGKHVIGNPTVSTGVTSAIKIADFVTGVDPGDIVTVTYLEQILGDAIDGTAGYLPKFGGDGIIDSVVREVSGNIGIGISPTQKLHVSGNILGTQLQSNVATGTAPLTVASTTLVANLHADFLNKSVIAGNGLVTGGLLTNNVTLDLGTPGTLTPSSINSVSADSHTHAITGIYSETDVDGFLALKADKTTTITVNGTSGRISSSAGAQSLAANRTWNLDLVATGVSAGSYQRVDVDIYGRITGGSNPNTLAGYGITDAVPESTTITINGTAQDLSANRTWNVGTITGSGTTGYFPKFTGPTALGNSVMQDTGSEINVASSRSFGVEGPAAMRSYAHFHDYVSIGKIGNHGSLVIHAENSAIPADNAALEVRSTTKGFLPPRMTRAQRLAIPAGDDWLVVVQTDIVGASNSGLKLRYPGGLWVGLVEELG